MYIKQVIIEGFKSYKDQTISEPFSNKINVVVGANGSGKSNFFHAIRFVLNDSNTILRQEERQRLLHEGAGHAVLSAYVEIVFDNSDGRLPVDRDEVRLRRTIGLKKDEYYLDKKHITKNEVMNMLETAGFSRANPYYVVVQGKIQDLAKMTEKQRLELLKEIGGTKVYEERRKESMKLMADCNSKRQAINGLVEQLDTRLKELDSERQELQQYKQLDRQRRSLEYTILDRDITAVKDKLAALEKQREEAAAKAGAAQDETREVRLKLKATERELRTMKADQAELQQRKQELAAEKGTALRRRAKLELDVKELEDQVAADTGAQSSAAGQLAAIQREIAAKEKELEAASNKLAAAEAQESALSQAIATKTARLQALYARQGGEQQYSSGKERDAALKQEIAALEAAVATKRESVTLAQQQAEALEAEAAQLDKNLEAAEAELQEREGGAEQAQQEQSQLHAKRDELQNRQKSLWRREDDLKKDEAQLRDEMRQRDKIMESAAPRDITRGLNSVKRLVKEHGIQGVYGTLLELFDVPSNLNTAVETVAGNALFHIVVEDDAVATRLTELLIRGKCGRATFMPLNRLQPPNVQYPTKWGSDVVPLMKRLKTDAKFMPALQQIFGRFVVCRNLQLAAQVAAEDGSVSCVTMDGDQVERRGAMRGGFVDERKSRIEAMREYKALMERISEREQEITALQNELAEVAQEITNVTGEMTKLAAKKQHMQNGAAPLRAELRSLRSKLDGLQKQMVVKRKQASEVEGSVAALLADIEARSALIGTPLTSKLSAAEAKEVQHLQPQVAKEKEDLLGAKSERMAAQAQVEGLEELLTANLKRQEADLMDVAQLDRARSDVMDLQARRSELQGAQREFDAAAAAEKEADDKLDVVVRRIRELQAERDELQEAAAGDDRSVADQAKALEALVAKRSQLQVKRSDLERRVRELGTLPAGAYEEHRGRPNKELHSELHKTNSALKEFSHVNKKALDQYVGFAEQRDELFKRKQDNDRAEEKIQQLISTLDMRKDEAIERTFKGVALNFKQIFKNLVPGGKGELVMLKAKPRQREEENEDPDTMEGVDAGAGGAGPKTGDAEPMEKYSGVLVRVSFVPGQVVNSMNQLSGGQKTLVALALIFSIQRCDPAPFYLFDEIDAALDPQYRTTVAAMLREQANDARSPAQFIVTTFHPQIVSVADNIYGVSHRNRISRVVLVEREDALQFLQTEERKHDQQQQAQQQAGHGKHAREEEGDEYEDAVEEAGDYMDQD